MSPEKRESRLSDILRFFVSIIICQLAGIIGAFFTSASVSSWYVTLNKPSFTPPEWLFAPVWTSLYFLMSISLFLVWRKYKCEKQAGEALKIFMIQLLLNILWSLAFFGMEAPLSGLVIIIILLIFILITIVKFYNISKSAAILLIPYFLWVCYASVLNFYLWRLNI
ncbi:MAG: TspO/MBR family protein [Armatimonadota bacterium]